MYAIRSYYEKFSTLYQRSLYQSMRSLTRRNFQVLSRGKAKLSGDVRDAAERILDAEGEVMARLGRILERKIPALKIRIHGDYHLGHVITSYSIHYTKLYEWWIQKVRSYLA